MPFSKAEELVRRFTPAVDCQIRADAEHGLVAVWVTVPHGSRREDIVLDVVSTLATQAQLDVNEEQVHVAILPEDEPAGVVLEEIEHEGRVRLISYNLRVSEERTLAEVELQHGVSVALGRAESRGAGTSPELLAQACLDGVEKLVQTRVALRLLDFEEVRMSGEDVVCVLVQETEGRSERILVGAARGGGNRARAGAYAALDSVNRRLGRILSRAPRDYEIE